MASGTATINPSAKIVLPNLQTEPALKFAEVLQLCIDKGANIHSKNQQGEYHLRVFSFETHRQVTESYCVTFHHLSMSFERENEYTKTSTFHRLHHLLSKISTAFCMHERKLPRR